MFEQQKQALRPIEMALLTKLLKEKLEYLIRVMCNRDL